MLGMELKAYLVAKTISEEAFARLIGVKQSAVNRYCQFKRTPKPKVMREIMRVTKGKVTANDFAKADTSKSPPGDA